VALLEVRDLVKRFGGIAAVTNVSFDLDEGEILGLVGPNGAGKTALINLISGFYAGAQGSIRFAGQEILNRPIHVIARAGVARTFQNIRLFGRMSVLENVMVASKAEAVRPLRSFLRINHDAEIAKAAEYLRLVNLAEKADHRASSLAYGEARRLEIARALAGRPRLLVMDEPAAGMNERESEELAALIRICRTKVEAILLIEHDIALVRTLSTRLVAMDNGSKIADGAPGIVLADPAVRKAYVGDVE
jgi:branched-chain amino acid transport system ATP-binding protein